MREGWWDICPTTVDFFGAERLIVNYERKYLYLYLIELNIFFATPVCGDDLLCPHVSLHAKPPRRILGPR